MKTVTANYLKAQKGKSTFITTKVYYKRRYWNGSNAFIWESSWTLLNSNEVGEVDPITHQFDNQTLTEFKVSNLTLQIKNFTGKWFKDNPSGIFSADSGSTYGYEPYFMKFQIRTGYSNVGGIDIRVGGSVPGGGEELLTVFTGLATDFLYNSASKDVSVLIEGLETLLINGDGERVSNIVTAESIGTGDGITRNFYIPRAGVGKISKITVNSVEMVLGIDYVVSGLNDPYDGALVSFSQAPTIGYAITWDGSYWYKNKTVDQLIALQIAEAGITSSSITNATLGTIGNNLIQSGKTDYDAGTNTGLDTSSRPGQMKIDCTNAASSVTLENFNAGSLAGNGWFGITTVFPVDFDIVGAQLEQNATASGSSINATFLGRSYGRPIGFGTWQWKVKASGGTPYTADMLFMVNGDTTDWIGYKLTVKSNGWNFYYVEYKAGVNTVSDQLTYGSDVTLGTSFKTIQVSRRTNGEFLIYCDGTLVGKVTDIRITQADRLMIGQYTAGGKVFYEDIIIPDATLTAQHRSQTIDTLSGLATWSNLNVNQQSLSGIMSYKTRTSTDDVTYEAWTSVGTGNSIASGVKRYIQVELNISIATSSLPPEEQEPIIFYYSVGFTSNRVFTTLGIFSGMNCYNAVQELAKLTDFEWGLDDDESFFFRSRVASGPADKVISSGINLTEVVSFRYGFENAYATIRVTFGSIIIESTAGADVITSPLELYGRKVFNIVSSILVSNDASAADGLVDAFFDRLTTRKKVLKVRTDYMPEVELSDIVEVTSNHDNFSSPSVYPMATALVCKVVATRLDPSNKFLELDLEEII